MTEPSGHPTQHQEPTPHPSAMEPWLLVVMLVTSVAGAVIGLQLIVTLGVTPNTSIIGVLLAIIVSRVPLAVFRRFRSVHRQNLVQTSISAATFAAANSLLLTIGIPAALGRGDLVLPMLAGAGLALAVGLLVLYWLFDSRIFPARGAWPPGLAAAEAIRAGDQGGKRARLLAYGAVVGVGGAAAGVPMSAMGVAFIGNIWALTMFGVGLLTAGYSTGLFGFDLGDTYITHGVMVGAGLVALVQAILVITRRRNRGGAADTATSQRAAAETHTRDDRAALRGLGKGAVLYVLVGAVLALTSGLATDMGPLALVGWTLLGATACLAAELIVGLSAMHSGWFPAFATALVFLVLGLFLGYPVSAVVVLTGFVAAGSPAFADAGYDLKTGWLLRGEGSNPRLDLDGRRQQLLAGLVGSAVAVVVVFFVHGTYFENQMFPPTSEVFAETLRAGLEPGAIQQIALWAIPGAVLQLLGGSARQLGVMIATGLIVADPLAGWAVLAGLGIRVVWLRLKGEEAANTMAIVGGGIIAGDAIYSFVSSMFRAR